MSEVSAKRSYAPDPSVITFRVRFVPFDLSFPEVHHMRSVDHLRPIRRFKICTVYGWQKHWYQYDCASG